MSQAVFATSRAIDKNTMAEFRRFSSYYFPYINKLQYKLKPSLMFDSNEFQKSSVNMNKGASALHMYSPIKRLIINEFSKIWTYTNKKCIKKAINNHMRAKRRKMCSMPGSLRDTFKNSKIAKAAAMTLVAGGTFASAVTGAATDAVAGDGNIRYVKTEPGDTVKFIERLGGEASHGRYSLVVFSDNKAVLKAAYEIAQEIEKKTPYDVTYIHAPAVGPISRMLVIANGHTILDAQNGGGDIAGLKEDLQTGFKRGSEQLASTINPEPSGQS